MDRRKPGLNGRGELLAGWFMAQHGDKIPIVVLHSSRMAPAHQPDKLTKKISSQRWNQNNRYDGAGLSNECSKVPCLHKPSRRLFLRYWWAHLQRKYNIRTIVVILLEGIQILLAGKSSQGF
jgi:hypothetical protein